MVAGGGLENRKGEEGDRWNNNRATHFIGHVRNTLESLCCVRRIRATDMKV